MTGEPRSRHYRLTTLVVARRYARLAAENAGLVSDPVFAHPLVNLRRGVPTKMITHPISGATLHLLLFSTVWDYTAPAVYVFNQRMR